MKQKELKKFACDTAYTLLMSLDQIEDEDFIDFIVCSVLNNDSQSITEHADDLAV